MSTILSRCDELAAITSIEGKIARFHLTDEHRRANELVAAWMHDAGLTTWTDPAGNICGRREGREPGLPALVLGSHLDTVPDAGRYDGPLGVVLGIAVAERLRAVELPFALEVVGFGDEEGVRFGVAMLGSKAMSGAWEDEYFDASDAAGVTVREAMTGFGLDPSRIGDAKRTNLLGYLEAHIEQGPELEAAGAPLGVVTSICGARRFSLAILGEARHAGGTPYERRKDALIGASHAVLEVERIARERGVIATVGRLQAYPGAINVIAGRVEFSLDLRAEHDADRDASWDVIRETIEQRCAERGLQLTAHEDHSAVSVACAPHLQAAIATGIEAAGLSAPPRLYSRAGHDAMLMRLVTDVGMLFIRCFDGISHHPAEDVIADDIALAATALAQAVLAGLRAGQLRTRPQACRASRRLRWGSPPARSARPRRTASDRDTD